MLETISEAFHGGGWPMYPIAVCLLISWSIAAERVYALWFNANEAKEALLHGLNAHLMRADLQGAIRFISSQKQGPIAKIIKAGLLKVHRSDKEVQAALDQTSLEVLPYFEKRTGFLAVLSNGATLIGLMGTVLGLIHCFAAVANVDPSQKATILAAGIAEAMNCTAFGLMTAIPALFFFAIIQARTQKVTDDINETVVTVVNLVLSNRRKFGIQNTSDEAAVAGK